MQRSQLVETRRIENGRDFRQRNIELPVDEDLLQAQQLVLAVVAVAIVAGERGLQEAYFVIVMQRPHRNAGKLRQLIDCVGLHPSTSPQDSWIVPHVASGSTPGMMSARDRLALL
ncbi:hypothetical protein D3C72_2218950 [compost metagenome]